MFHCRENELYDLNRRYKKGIFECLLYGRRTGQYKIKALDYREMTAFLRLYGTCF